MPYQQTEEQRQAAFQAAGLSTTQQAGVTAGTGYGPITSAQLQQSSPVQVPGLPAPSNATATNASVPAPTVADITAPAPTSSAANQQQGILNSLATDAANAQGQKTLLASEEDKRGVTGLRTTANQLAGQIMGLADQAALLSNQYNLAGLDAQDAASRIDAESVGRGRTAAGVAPLVAGAQRPFIESQRELAYKQNAIASQALTLKGAYYAAQGNLELAQDAAQKAADLQFEAQQQVLDTKIAQLNALAPILNREEKQQAFKQQVLLSERNRILQDQKGEREKVSNTMLIAAKYGAPNDVLARIMQSETEGDAILASAGYLEDPKAQYELEEARLRVTKLRLENAALESASKPLPITGNFINDIATALKSNKVGATTRTQLSAILGVQGALEQMAKDNPSGSFEGISRINKLLDLEIPFTDAKLFNLIGRDALMSEGAVTSRAYIQGINLKVQQWASGAALTAEQTKQVKQMTPIPSDSDWIVRRKVNALYEFMNQQTRAAMLSEGINVSPPSDVDLWKKTDSLEAIFNQ